MKKQAQTQSQIPSGLRWCALLTLVYALAVLLLPANTATASAYDLSSASYRIILLSIMLPSFIVWFTAFIGYGTLQRYAQSIKGTAEAPYFTQLADGAKWLAWSLPVAALTSIVLNSMGNRFPDFHDTGIILVNYISLILPLIAFFKIGHAVRNLISEKGLEFSIFNARIISILFTIAGMLYCYLTLRNFESTSLLSTNNPYFLPVWLMVLTVIVPYLYMWFIGILAAYQLFIYSKNMQGILYRRALLYVACGLAAVIISSIAIQYLNTVIPRVGHLMIDHRLMLNILFRILAGTGFILLAIGATRLKKIEEV
jgi:hypothetical protein